MPADHRPAAAQPQQTQSHTAGGEAEFGSLLTLLAQQLAERLAPLLAQQLTTGQPAAAAPARRLLTLDQLIELLPAGKKPKTWKGWLYQRTRHGKIPGCQKIGNRLFFDQHLTVLWLTNSGIAAPVGHGLDLSGPPSHHGDPMPPQPHTDPDNPQNPPH